jgi:L-threonylcarbamoyladenylate synthase
MPVATRLLRIQADHIDQRQIQAAAQVIREGRLVAFPTETVYGLGADACNLEAVQRIFDAKDRPASDPVIVHIATPEQLVSVAVNVPLLAWELAQRFWPGPLTLVLRRHQAVAANVAQGRGTVAVRVPNHPVALALLNASRTPIAAPSANLFARPSPTTAQHVLDDLGGKIDLVLDGGPTGIGLESTVVDLTAETPALLRPGGTPVEALRQVMPELVLRSRYLQTSEAGASPGMFLKHYSPAATLMLFTGPPVRAIARMKDMAARLLRQNQHVGLLLTDEDARQFDDPRFEIVRLGVEDDLEQIGHNLFAGMRELEQRGVSTILVRDVAREGLGLAIWDRLFRAADGRVVEADSGDSSDGSRA